MSKTVFYLLFITIISVLITGCATNQSASFQNQFGMMSERKNVNDYKEFRAKFIEYAQTKNSENLYGMMAFYGYDKSEMFELFKNEIFPFFSDYKKVVGTEFFNIVKDEAGDPGYSMYGFMMTTNNEKKPYVLAIIEKNNSLVVKNFVVNKCFKGFHSNC